MSSQSFAVSLSGAPTGVFVGNVRKCIVRGDVAFTLDQCTYCPDYDHVLEGVTELRVSAFREHASGTLRVLRVGYQA
jgi:hypothetical protein